ncbi:MAG TPA: magnesium transporter, partial [Kiloniellaceae bacterium]|nr:magnesium transporter [Kiloniellaceae bacterium]
MGQTETDKDDGEAWLPDISDEVYGLTDDVILKVQEALENDDGAELKSLIEDLHEADLADLLESLSRDEREKLVRLSDDELIAEALPYLDNWVTDEIIETLEPKALAKSLAEFDSDDTVEVLEDLDEEVRDRILAALPMGYRALVEESLTFPEESAGRLMQREMAVVPETWTVGETIDYMRAGKDLPDDFYDLFIVDPKHHPAGRVPLSRVMRTKRPVHLTEIMETDLRAVPATMDQEEVAYIFRQYGLVSAPVVDEDGRLLGVITVDDVVHIIDEEAEEDLMKLGGVTETDIFSDVRGTAKARVSWLAVNLMTAVAASLVIGVFEGTIQQVVALAVLMPIVASMGGNAGTQTLTVAVRAIAMKDLTVANAKRFIGKEVIVGIINGLLFALLTGSIAWFWFDSPAIGLVLAAAMVI